MPPFLSSFRLRCICRRIHTLGFVFLICTCLISSVAGTALADETCSYPGFLGGPFPGTPACTEGFKTVPLTCDRCSWYPERDERLECAEESDCVEMVGKYMACGGPIGPFVVDDQDNVYFWSSRWNLHALDKRGNLRWRFDLCKPAEDTMCQLDRQSCFSPDTRIPAMVMDYHGTLFFFIGEMLYAISSQGELLLKHRVEIPGIELFDHWTLAIGSGVKDNGGAGSYSEGGSPVLHIDGTISAAYAVSGGATGDVFPTGVITLSRSGEVLGTAHYPWKTESQYAITKANLVGAPNDQLLFTGWSLELPQDGSWDFLGKAHALDNLQPIWKTEQPKDFSTIGAIPSDHIGPDLAVGPQGRVYGVTMHGAVYGYDLATKTQKRIFNFQRPNSVTWQNRPTVAPDGTMYLVTATRSGGYIWALDTEALWQNPVSERADYQWMPDPANFPGLKWGRVYGGAGGWSTAAISANDRVYTAQGGIAAHDAQTGDQIWWFGERTMASAPTILSDGTIVVGQGITGRVFFLEEDTPNGGHAQSGWPLPRHDRYMSNNADHPFRWDRTTPPPYRPLDALLVEAPPCWNYADWDTQECGPLPEPRYRTEPPDEQMDAGGDASDADVGHAADAPSAIDASSRGDTDTSNSDPDVDGGDASDLRSGDNQQTSRSGDCAGCSSVAPDEGALGGLFAACLAGLLLVLRRIRPKR